MTMQTKLNQDKRLRQHEKNKINYDSLLRRGYTFGKTLGKGSYASVLKAKFRDPDTGNVQELACKLINKLKAPTDFMQKFFPRELEALAKINHPHIIRVHSILQSGSAVFIFMRCAEYGDLLDYVKGFGSIGESQANLWFFQMASAVSYLHSLNIAHRDLKCENILISKHLNVKIADFGFARNIFDKNGDELMSSTFCGSAAYASPEIVGGIAYHPDKADIWALGIVLFIILNGSMPFNDSNLVRLRQDQNAGRILYNEEIYNALSKECQEVIHVCLTPNPKERPSIETVLGLKWLEKRVRKSTNKELCSFR